jgi:hypothetical protein
MLRPYDDLLVMVGTTFIGVLSSARLRGIARALYLLLALLFGYLISAGGDIHTGLYAVLALIGALIAGFLMALILWRRGALP